ncbi:MAG TPA: Rne/Rng family ribonuclease [Bacteroidales bacterium]|nr:Rne/Rng family ribonuclease [Bacteroidales bacterium]HOS71934.1 Rne/Rng family ribonuclease [Bacteroidales bacterium]HQH22855.1 Rne/Rng family ribonuclease [Bacteroidales bacterium]HQJ81679.1 Rne/Rng family ribonuclease [Bacteroidales bacterium]
MGNKDLIIDASDSEVSIALLENRQLTELDREKRTVRFSVGDIYLGKVKKIMPGLNAAFINVGYERDAFLHYLDLGPQFRTQNKYYIAALQRQGRPGPVHRFKPDPDIDKNGKIKDVLTVGQTVIVQITKEPISTKGPRLSSEISIAGRNLVLIPFSDKVSISAKIENPEEKNRLKSLLQSIKPKNYGIIVRTAAEGKKVAVLDAELRELVKKWESTFSSVKKDIKAPKLFIGEMNRTTTILRDLLNVAFSSIHVNDSVIAGEIRTYINEIAPEKAKIVKIYQGRVPIFDHFGVNRQIKALFGRTVSFRHGAYLIIEHTEALHVIDVNSGNRSRTGNDQESNALEVNLEAAAEIARQLRLRDLGGIIVIDFIDMQSGENKQILYEKVKELMQTDRTKHNILPLTKFGLMQITRQRVRPEMHIVTNEKCPACSGTGEIKPSILFTDELEKNLEFIVDKIKTRIIYLNVHPFIAAYLKKGLFPIYLKWSLKYRILLRVQAVVSAQYLEYHYLDRHNNEIDLI